MAPHLEDRLLGLDDVRRKLIYPAERPGEQEDLGHALDQRADAQGLTQVSADADRAVILDERRVSGPSASHTLSASSSEPGKA